MFLYLRMDVWARMTKKIKKKVPAAGRRREYGLGRILAGSGGASKVKHLQQSAHREVDFTSILSVYGSNHGLNLISRLLIRHGHISIHNFYTHTPLRTHPPTVIQGFRADAQAKLGHVVVFCPDAHSLTRKCCWKVVLLYVPSNNPPSLTNPCPPSHDARSLR